MFGFCEFLHKLTFDLLTLKVVFESRVTLATDVANVTCDSNTTFKVKRSKVNLQGAGAY